MRLAGLSTTGFSNSRVCPRRTRPASSSSAYTSPRTSLPQASMSSLPGTIASASGTFGAALRPAATTRVFSFRSASAAASSDAAHRAGAAEAIGSLGSMLTAPSENANPACARNSRRLRESMFLSVGRAASGSLEL